MAPKRYIALFGLLNALALYPTDPSAHAAQAKGQTSQRTGQVDARMSSKGQENTNAQWSADPDRGWVRADERHDLQQQKQNTVKEKKKGGKKLNDRKTVKH